MVNFQVRETSKIGIIIDNSNHTTKQKPIKSSPRVISMCEGNRKIANNKKKHVYRKRFSIKMISHSIGIGWVILLAVAYVRYLDMNVSKVSKLKETQNISILSLEKKALFFSFLHVYIFPSLRKYEVLPICLSWILC